MAETDRSTIILYMIFFGIVLFLLYCGYQLHETSRNRSLAKKSILGILENDKSRNLIARNPGLVKSIEHQLDCASTVDNNWVAIFRKDSAAYPGNAILFAFNTILKLHAEITDVNASDSIFTFNALVYDKQPIKIFFRFALRDDNLILTDINDLCPLYQRVNCDKEYMTKQEQ